jgi:hypothetical protein
MWNVGERALLNAFAGRSALSGPEHITLSCIGAGRFSGPQTPGEDIEWCSAQARYLVLTPHPWNRHGTQKRWHHQEVPWSVIAPVRFDD